MAIFEEGSVTSTGVGDEHENRGLSGCGQTDDEDGSAMGSAGSCLLDLPGGPDAGAQRSLQKPSQRAWPSLAVTR